MCKRSFGFWSDVGVVDGINDATRPERNGDMILFQKASTINQVIREGFLR